MTEQSPIEMAPQGVDIDAFRKVMRSLAGTVTVISTENQGALYGFTATAVCSVCAEPPTLLIAVNRSTRTYPHIANKSAFSVNVIAANQRDVAERFGTKADNVFATVPHRLTDKGVPVIADAAAAMVCTVSQVMDVGTHTVFFGRIEQTEISGKPPLVYYNGSYGAFSMMAG